MKIAFLSRWNATCGAGLHAELLCRKLLSMGFNVLVFAPSLESANADWHHRMIDVEDEEWVTRVYEETSELEYPAGGFMGVEVLEDDYDVLVVELYNRLPVLRLAEIHEKIRRKAKLIGVLHLAWRRDIPPILKIKWDAMVIFDKRYYNELLAHHDLSNIGRIEEISYPFAILDSPPTRIEEAKDRFLFITYGRQPELEYLDYIRGLREICSGGEALYFVLRSDGRLPVDEPWMIQRVDRPSLRRIHGYLRGADAHLIPKSDTRGVVISSTIYQSLYSGTPTIVPDTRYFENIPSIEEDGPVMKYRLGDLDDFIEKARRLMKDYSLRERLSENARRYALEASDEVVAKRFLELFESL